MDTNNKTMNWVFWSPSQEDEETQLAMALSKSLAEDAAQVELDVLQSLAMVAPTAVAQQQVQGQNSKGKGKKNKK